MPDGRLGRVVAGGGRRAAGLLPRSPRDAVRVWAAEADDESFIGEMARLACMIEGRPLPPVDDPAVVAMLPGTSGRALLAVDDDGRRVGAAWWFFHEPPLLRTEAGAALPELAVAVVEDARDRGIGTALIEALAAEASMVFGRLSLNVHVRNPAVRLYSRTGFVGAGAGRGPLGVAMMRNLRNT